MTEANRIFRAEYGGGLNFMTPNVLERGLVRDRRGHALAYEIAEGEGMRRGDYGPAPRIFGVSIVRAYPNGRTRRNPLGLSRLCYSRREAAQYVRTLHQTLGRRK